MTTTPADYLREARLWALRDAKGLEAEAVRLEEIVATTRAKAAKLREQACAFGAGVQMIEGEEAPLDLPKDRALPSQLEPSH